MTTVNEYSRGASAGSALRLEAEALVARVRGALSRYATYRRTLAELEDLSPRALADLGLHRADLRAVARDAAYGR